MKALVGTTYCGSIEYYSILKNADTVILDCFEHYSKQSYRNRCEIYGANGKLKLSIPLIRRGKRVPVNEALIDNSENWQKLHWRSIESAYRSSPYFEFYEHHFIPIYEKEFTHLIQFNEKLQNVLLKVLQVDCDISYSKSYEKENEEYTDYRELIHPRNLAKNPVDRYIQVFESKCGFIPNLSILDLLFNEGPNAISYL